MEVHYTEIIFILTLNFDPVADRTEIVTQMEVAGGLDSR
jgi:hypothetical protein